MDGPLNGIRVVEAGGQRLEYAGKLLADLGADVIKVEPAGGDPSRQFAPADAGRPAGLRSLTFNVHNAGKRSVTIDRPGTARLLELAAWADIFLLEQGTLTSWDITSEQVHSSNPDLVVVAVADFGLSGPRSNWRGSDLIALAAGGLLAQSGEPEGPPYQLAGSQAFLTAGVYSAANALIALRAVMNGAPGQVIDLSLQEVVGALTTLVGVPKMLADGVPSRRQHNGRASGGHPTGLYRTSDGLISISLARAGMWVTLAKWIHEVTGNEEVLDPMFEGSGLNRQRHADLIDIFIEEMTTRFTASYLFHEGQRRGLAFALVSTPQDLFDDPHFNHREYWTRIQGETGPVSGPPYRFSRSEWAIQGSAPLPGADNDLPLAPLTHERQSSVAPGENRGALEGLRVVEFTVAGAGPWVGRHLAYHGAEVIRIESHGHPDFVRTFVPPWDPGRGIDPQASPWLAEWNSGKLNVGLNLQAPGGRELAEQLCLRADIVIENHKPGFLDKNGLGFEALARQNPRLIMLSMQGYGAWGPYASYLSWGYNLEPMAGLSIFSGGPDRPMSSPIAYPDWLAGLHGVVALMAVIREREHSGVGQSIELAQVEAAMSTVGALFRDFAVTGGLPERIGNRSRNWAPQGVFRGRDRVGRDGPEDTWLALSVLTDDQWRALCSVMGDPHLASQFPDLESRLLSQDAIESAISAWVSEKEVPELAESLQAAGIPAHLAQDTLDLMTDPHLTARSFYSQVPHAAKGTEVVTGLGGRFSGTATGVPYSGGPIGGDNHHVFCGLLGLGEAEYAAAIAAGAIEEPTAKR